MSHSKIQSIFLRITKCLPPPIARSLDRLSPGLLLRLTFGITKQFPDDIFVVSYPRSGNTWTRYILAYLKAGVQQPLTSEDVGLFAPDIYHHLPVINAATSKRVIKTHEAFLHLYPRVIFIHRDPREALVSYWHFARRTRVFEGSFSEFLRSPIPNQHGSWKKNMLAMQSKIVKDPQNIFVIRYDQLQNEFHNTVAKMVQWSGIGNNVNLDAVYELTKIESMATSDSRCDSMFRRKSGESFFVDRGKGSDWRNVWTATDLDWLAKDREMISIMEQNGYI